MVKSPIQNFLQKMHFMINQNSLRQCLKICGHDYVIIISRLEECIVNLLKEYIVLYMASSIMMMQFNSMQLFKIPYRFE